VICEYLDDLAGGTIYPRSGKARWQTLTLEALADGMLDACLLARYEDVARPEALRWSEWRAAQLDKVETGLAYLEATPQLLQDRVDIGALATGCVLWYVDLRFPEVNWRDRYPLMAQWYAVFSQRPSMQAVWALK
jgi:glutathione S-transferase